MYFGFTGRLFVMDIDSAQSFHGFEPSLCCSAFYLCKEQRVLHTLYLMRHGKSTANVGWPVIPDKQAVMTERGHEQAQGLAERLNHVHTSAV